MSLQAANHEMTWKQEFLDGYPTESSVADLLKKPGLYNAPSPFQGKLGTIEYAVKSQVPENILRLLINAKAVPVEFPHHDAYHVLNCAFFDGRPEAVINLLFQTAVVPTQPTTTAQGKYVRGTLDFAIGRKYSWAVVQELLKRGAKASPETIKLAEENGYFKREGVPANAEQVLKGDRPSQSGLSSQRRTAHIPETATPPAEIPQAQSAPRLARKWFSLLWLPRGHSACISCEYS